MGPRVHPTIWHVARTPPSTVARTRLCHVAGKRDGPVFSALNNATNHPAFCRCVWCCRAFEGGSVYPVGDRPDRAFHLSFNAWCKVEAKTGIVSKGHACRAVGFSSVSRGMTGEEMRKLRIAACTIVAALLVAGLTVPFGAARAGSKHHLNFKSIDVALPSVTFTSALGINAQGDIVGRYAVESVGHGYLLSDGTYTTIDAPDRKSV